MDRCKQSLQTWRMPLHDRIRTARTRPARDWTQAQLGAALDPPVTRVSVSWWESESPKKRTTPGLDRLQQIAKVLGVRYEWLATGKGPMEDERVTLDEAMNTVLDKAVLINCLTRFFEVLDRSEDKKPKISPVKRAKIFLIVYENYSKYGDFDESLMKGTIDMLV